MTHKKFIALLDKQRKAESDMRRAFRKWDKLRAQVQRAEKTLDRDFVRRAESIGGSVDFRDFETEGCGGDAILNRNES
jgi:hypothetical protein